MQIMFGTIVVTYYGHERRNILMIYLNRNMITALLLITLAIVSINLLAQSNSAYNSKFMNQSVPDRMSPGQKYNLILTYQNAGTTTWVPGEVKLKIFSDDDKKQSIWSVNEFDLPENIEPGSTVSFMVDLTAPTTEGVHLFSSQLHNSQGFFGETGKALEISISREVGLSDAFNSSAFVEQTVPPVMEVGKPYKVMISYTNTGSVSWPKDMYRLVMLDAAGNAMKSSKWSNISVNLDETIRPGSSKVFNFEIIPIESGTYTLQWRMASGETGLFGDVTNPAVITVNPVIEKKNEGKSGKYK